MAGLDTETEKQKIGFKWGTSKSRNWGHSGNTWNSALGASSLVCVGQVLRSGFIYRLTSLSTEYQKQRKNEETAGKEESKGCCLLCG